MTQLQLPKIRRKVLGDQLANRLAAVPGGPTIAVYRGEVSARARWPQVPGSVDPPLLQTSAGQPDPSGVIAPYVVLFDGTGPTSIEPALDPMQGEELRWTPQTTVAAGTTEDCIQAVDRVCAWLKPWQPVLDDVAAGFLVLPPGFDPGPPRPDRTVEPHRVFVPLLWRLDLTT